MTHFKLIALGLIAVWLLLVAVRYRRSTAVLTGGLVGIASFALGAIAFGGVPAGQFGLGIPESWLSTFLFAGGGLIVLLLYSPLADRIATRIFDKPPTLGAFKALQQSLLKLMAGIVLAWVLGGFLEELVFRGVVIPAVEALLLPWTTAAIAVPVAIATAAAGAGIIHLYQGPRAALIITQLSVLFGILFVSSGNNLWTVILAHGLYDTIAFIRFATGKSRYAKFANET